jgi:hypothetical protein
LAFEVTLANEPRNVIVGKVQWKLLILLYPNPVSMVTTLYPKKDGMD